MVNGLATQRPPGGARYSTSVFTKDFMGITIHYAGRATSEDSIADAYRDCLFLARGFGWEAPEVPPELLRERGLVLLPHPDCEPVHIRFSRTRRFSEFCKTQFAGPVVHRQVRDLIQTLSLHLSRSIVYDEAEEFEDDDGESVSLEEAFSRALQFIEDGLAEYPGAQMKVRLPSGRIADLYG